MDKTADVFFEILLKNYNAITEEAQYQRETQNIRMYQKHSKDRTADMAIDNITGGQMVIDANGQARRLRNLQAWDMVLVQSEKYFRSKEHSLEYKIFHLCYVQRGTNREALKKLKISRAKLFTAKDNIKNLVHAAACEMGLWHALPKKF